jgi:hypothetical protein
VLPDVKGCFSWQLSPAPGEVFLHCRNSLVILEPRRLHKLKPIAGIPVRLQFDLPLFYVCIEFGELLLFVWIEFYSSFEKVPASACFDLLS